MKPRLSGKAILLSASVPSARGGEEYLRVPDAHLHIDEAVISLARAVFVEDGRLIYGGHPSISRLLADVAGEYAAGPELPAAGKAERPPLVVYQSRAFQRLAPPVRRDSDAADDGDDYLPEDTHLLIRLGFAEVHWIERKAHEEFKPELGIIASRQVPQSLGRMRAAMIADHLPELLAMVCVGGMEGVVEEADCFLALEHDLPLYVFPTTGGAAAKLARERRDRRLRVVPDEWLIRTTVSPAAVCAQAVLPPASELASARPAALGSYQIAMQRIVELLTVRS